MLEAAAALPGGRTIAQGEVAQLRIVRCERTGKDRHQNDPAENERRNERKTLQAKQRGSPGKHKSVRGCAHRVISPVECADRSARKECRSAGSRPRSSRRQG